MNAFELKLLAAFTMIIDHVGAVFFPQYHIFRIIGRISFPVFCFLLVEGFYNTKNIYKYILRMVLLAGVSEPFYDKLFFGKWIVLNRSNVFITLTFGLIMMYVLARLPKGFEKAVAYAAFLAIALYIPMDYGIFGIAMIGGFYFFRQNRIVNVGYQCVINMYCMGGLQKYGAISSIITMFYNGKKGYSRLKYAFYLLYPMHIIVFLILRRLL